MHSTNSRGQKPNQTKTKQIKKTPTYEDKKTESLRTAVLNITENFLMTRVKSKQFWEHGTMQLGSVHRKSLT